MRLSDKSIEYILYHLDHTVDLNSEIRSSIVVEYESDAKNDLRGKIIFKESENIFDLELVETVDNIPALFPLSNQMPFYHIDENQNLIVNHSLLKSSYYLLSGMQEYNSSKKDDLGRFPYEESVQKKLGIINKPIVNYYFEIISKGIIEFCNVHHIQLRKKALFDNFGFMLTHDIDKVDQYDLYFAGDRLKEIMGLSRRNYSKLNNIALLLKATQQLLGISKKQNDYWNFDFLINSAKERGFKNVFYFLGRDQLHVDAYYNYEDIRIKELILNIVNQECEVGLHGTVASATDKAKLEENYALLSKISQQQIYGIRQHRLTYEHPLTLELQEMTGIKYDTTLGFAAHEGFRNSYCLPFKLFNFSEDRMIDVWEIPLNVMDVTLFDYRNLTFEEADRTITEILEEIIKFNGIFTLLWHNTFFDEIKYPGITKFYTSQLDKIKKKGAKGVTGIDIVNQL